MYTSQQTCLRAWQLIDHTIHISKRTLLSITICIRTKQQSQLMHSTILWLSSIKQEVGNMLNPQILAGNCVANEDLRDCADLEQCGDNVLQARHQRYHYSTYYYYWGGPQPMLGVWWWWWWCWCWCCCNTYALYISRFIACWSTTYILNSWYRNLTLQGQKYSNVV